MCLPIVDHNVVALYSIYAILYLMFEYTPNYNHVGRKTPLSMYAAYPCRVLEYHVKLYCKHVHNLYIVQTTMTSTTALTIAFYYIKLYLFYFGYIIQYCFNQHAVA